MSRSIKPRSSSVRWLCACAAMVWLLAGVAAPGMCSTADGLNNQPGKTPETGDPVSAGTGEQLMTFPLFHLPGPFPVDLKLYYMSQSFSPSELGDRFFLNVPYMWRAGDDISVPFVNGMDEVEFHKHGEDDWRMVGHSSWPYELKAAGDRFFLKNPASNTVLYFEKHKDFLYLCRKRMDRAGNALVYTYKDFVGKAFPGLVSIESSSGMRIDIDMALTGGIWAVTRIRTGDEDGLSYTFSYESDRLASMKNPEGGVTTFAYDDEGCLIAATTPRGTTPCTSEYDTVEVHGTGGSMFIPVVVKQVDALGNSTAISYDFPDNKVAETRPDGERNVFVTAGYRGEFGRTSGVPEEMSLAGLGTLDFEGNEEGNIIEGETEGGSTLSVQYDSISGRLSSYAVGGDGLSMTYGPVAQTFDGLHGDSAEFTFADETSRLYRPDNLTESLTYDGKGGLLTFRDAAGSTWTYTRNGQGQVTRLENPLGAAETFSYNANRLLASHTSSLAGTTALSYDDYGRLAAITDRMGHSRTFEYDDMGRLVKETDELGQATRMAYDENGNLASTTDPMGSTTRFTYDAMDRLVEARSANGETATLDWDAMGRVASTTGPSGISTRYEYTPAGLVSRMTKGGYAWKGTYDTDGLLAAEIESGGLEYAYAYDDAGRVVRIEDEEGRVWQYAYDSFGNVLAGTDPAGRTVRYAYDGAGRLVETTLPGNRTGRYSYDAAGNLVEIVTPGGGRWRFEYTPAGRLTRQIDPLGGATTYAYDALGRMEGRTDASGAVRNFEYDAADRLTRTASGGDALTYSYDANGRMTRTRGIELAYDALSRVTRCVSGDTTYDLAWNAKGQLTRLSRTPGDLVLTYTYDATTGNILSVSDSKGLGSATFTYDAAGRVTRIARKNGISSTFAYSAATGGITRITEGDFTDATYTLDTLGRVVALDGVLPLDPGDCLAPLDEVHTVNAMSQATDDGYAYDAAGRLVATPDLTLAWDGLSRLAGVNDATYAYDGSGRLISAALGGSETLYSYCGTVDTQIPLRIHNDDIEWIQVVMPGWGLVYSIRVTSEGESVAYYHTDRRGSVVAVTDAAGSVTHRFAYTPYGRLLTDENADPPAAEPARPPFLFLGHYGCHALPGTDLLYRHGARAYLPAAGRFASPEPEWPSIGNPALLNVYNYAASEPVNLVDYNGLDYTMSQLRDLYADFSSEILKKPYEEPRKDPDFNKFPDYRRIPVRTSSDLNAALEENKGEIWVDFTLAYHSPFREVVKGLGKINPHGGRARIIPEENFERALEIAENLLVNMGYDTRYGNGNFLGLGRDIVEWIWWERERLKKVRREISLARALLLGEGELSPGAGMVQEAMRVLGFKPMKEKRKKETMSCDSNEALRKVLEMLRKRYGK